MKNHFDAKHPKEDWNVIEQKYKDVWAGIKAELAANDKSKTLKLTGKAAKKAEKEAAEKAEEEKRKAAEARAARKAARDSGGAGAVKDLAAEKEAAVMKVAMPKVKKAQALQDAENFAAAIPLYEDALADFLAGGLKRPKLVERLEACKKSMLEAVES
eukprot:SAG22_NODE_522_length_9503_cov_4.233624_9_plen_158_part_00